MSSNNALATFAILVNGSPIDSSFQVNSITVQNSLNQVATATISLLDGSSTGADFPISSGSTFVPGNAIEIQVGFNGVNSTVFTGIVAAQSMEYAPVIGSTLVVTATDAAVKMTIGRSNNSFSGLTDSAVITALIQGHGLKADVDATTTVWPTLTQYGSTDWDFLIARAEANGMYVSTHQNQVSVKRLAATVSSLTLTYGVDILQFSGILDARRQLGAVTAESWDYATQSLATANAAAPTGDPSQGNLSGNALSKVAAPNRFWLSTSAQLPATALQEWADAELLRSRFAKIRCTIKCRGTAVLPGDVVTLAGFGDRFNGDAFISAVSHTIEHENWITTITTGIDETLPTSKPNVTAPAAAGLLPGIQGLLTAKVLAIAPDPNQQFRVCIHIPVLHAPNAGTWARMGNNFATKGAGFFWMPEIGDEVIVGFLNDDPNAPVILGSLYSSQLPPAQIPAVGNALKSISSTSQVKIEFDDTNASLLLTTPGNNQVVLNDAQKSISLSDQNGNKVVLSSAGISLQSPSDIVIQAGGEISLKSGQGLEIQSTNDLTLKANQAVKVTGFSIDVLAQTELKAEGAATAEFSSCGETTVKGAIVMIN